MAWQEPKTDWNETYEPSPNDLNRIEGNISALKNDAITINGVKTFKDGIKVDVIGDISGNGIAIGGVLLKNGVITGLVWGA